MDESLIEAAKDGNAKELYRLIQGDGNLLRKIDEVEFADTPLHVAAREGRTDFAMEIMNLKPSFARKLNQDGLSPMHLAIEMGHKDMALCFLEVDKDLVRVRGKKGKTVLHYLCKKERNSAGQEGNSNDLLDKILEAYPECMRDVTTKKRTALHIAVKHNRLDVLKVLIRTLRKTEYCKEVTNRKDKDGNTVLHIAAINNEPQVLKLLLKCKPDKHLTNRAKKTALDLAEDLNNGESISILHGFPIRCVSTLCYNLETRLLRPVTKASSMIFHDMDSISSDDRNALLVILGLLLTATYQASLSPPGSVRQDDSSPSPTPLPIPRDVGKSVMKGSDFLLFYIPTCAVFMVTLFLTLALLKPYPYGFRTALQVLLAFLATSFQVAVSFIAPDCTERMVIRTISLLVFITMMFMCMAYRVSRISVLVLGFWVISVGLSPLYYVGSLILICWLFLVLYDEFWKGTVLVIGYCLIVTAGDPVAIGILLGCWFFLGLCRFCIQGHNFFYTRWNSMSRAYLMHSIQDGTI